MPLIPWDLDPSRLCSGASTKPPFRHQHNTSRALAVGDVLLEQRRGTSFSGIGQAEFEKRWVGRTASGDVYMPEFCSAIHGLRRELSCPPFDRFSEMAFPRLLSFSVASRFGLADSWPEILMSVRAFQPSREERFLGLTDSGFILDPVQCAPFYEWMTERILSESDLPICVRENLGGWSYRNERQDTLRTVRKSAEFLRDEYVFVGTGEHVHALRAQLLEAFCSLLGRKDLTFRVVVGAGCFQAEEETLSRNLRRVSKVSDIPILDVEMFLPETEEWLEVAGSSLWGSRLTDAFNIRSTEGRLESGCMGVGISRLALAILAQGEHSD